MMIEKCLLNKCFGFLVPTFGPAHLISATTYTLSQHAYQLLFAGVCVAHMLRCVCVCVLWMFAEVSNLARRCMLVCVCVTCRRVDRTADTLCAVVVFVDVSLFTRAKC